MPVPTMATLSNAGSFSMLPIVCVSISAVEQQESSRVQKHSRCRKVDLQHRTVDQKTPRLASRAPVSCRRDAISVVRCDVLLRCFCRGVGVGPRDISGRQDRLEVAGWDLSDAGSLVSPTKVRKYTIDRLGLYYVQYMCITSAEFSSKRDSVLALLGPLTYMTVLTMVSFGPGSRTPALGFHVDLSGSCVLPPYDSSKSTQATLHANEIWVWLHAIDAARYASIELA